jgi:hypothetical protein
LKIARQKGDEVMRKYLYKGAVYAWGSLVLINWSAVTCADSRAKALSNLKFQFRKMYNYANYVPICLSGDFEIHDIPSSKWMKEAI